MASVSVSNSKDNYFKTNDYISSGQIYSDDPIPRSTSPECLEIVPTHPHDKCPSLEASRGRGSNDTTSSTASSIRTPISSPSLSVPPEIKLVKPIPVKKPTKRLSNVFGSGGLFGSLKMTPASPKNIDSLELSTSETSSHRRFSGASGHSSSSVSSTASKIGKSFSRIMGSSFKKSPVDMTCGSLGVVPLLSEKYGDYVKPDHRSTKGMGSTSKKNIASGATAVIRLVRQRPAGRVLAVKEFKKRDKTELERDYQKRMLNEYTISKSASNFPHIVETLDLVKDEKGRWCVVMEYCSGGDVFNLLHERPNLTLDNAACLFKQLLLGLQHLHKLGIVHRDIKPENLVLTSTGTLKIADFGVAEVVQTCFEKEAHFCKKWCGSEPFWSPEMWKLKDDTTPYDGKALDVWSAATTYFCIRFHQLPFVVSFFTGRPGGTPPAGSMVGSPAAVAAQAEDGGDLDYRRYVEQRKKLDPSDCDLFKDFTQLERECLASMLDPDPTTRSTIDQVLECPWITKVDVCQDGQLSDGYHHSHSILSK
ncbi:MAG: kinase-like domain-containing protein [Benjaminiella poitrasii]|nr:MAG: kinase-like domain-containing protein [Benjaminiella poitrasii]